MLYVNQGYSTDLTDARWRIIEKHLIRRKVWRGQETGHSRWVCKTRTPRHS